jgi:hypothetical protein
MTYKKRMKEKYKREKGIPKEGVKWKWESTKVGFHRCENGRRQPAPFLRKKCRAGTAGFFVGWSPPSQGRF